MKSLKVYYLIIVLVIMSSIVYSQQMEVESNSDANTPTLLLKETQSSDFARLWFQTASPEKWGLLAKPTAGEFDIDNILASPIVFAYEGQQILGLSSTGKLRINKSYVLPNADGVSGQVMTTDGSGVVGWTTVAGSGGATNKIEDTDGDTFIETTDANEVVVEVDGESFLHMKYNAFGQPQFELMSDNNNYFIGEQSGDVADQVVGNVGLGKSSLLRLKSGNNNTAVGLLALAENINGGDNAAYGRQALRLALGSSNTALGSVSLYNLVTGNDNTAIGRSAGLFVENGGFSVFIGSYAGYGLGIHDKEKCTIIGYEAGVSANGDGNVFIGYKAGSDETGDDKLYIENTDSATPLIYGDFANDEVIINGSLEVTGHLLPEAHKSDDLGQSGLAWDNVYCDDIVNQGAASFNDRSVVEEIIKYGPRAKTMGMFDYKTDKGLEELDPASLPAALVQDNGILVDEMASYNYKANYEQQLMINNQNTLILRLENTVEDQKQVVAELLLLLEKQNERIDKLEGK